MSEVLEDGTATLANATAVQERDLVSMGFLCLELFFHCFSEIGCHFVGWFIGEIDTFLLSRVHSMRRCCDCEKNLYQVFDRYTFSAPLMKKQWFLECHLSVMYICLVSA